MRLFYEHAAVEVLTGTAGAPHNGLLPVLRLRVQVRLLHRERAPGPRAEQEREELVHAAGRLRDPVQAVLRQHSGLRARLPAGRAACEGPAGAFLRNGQAARPEHSPEHREPELLRVRGGPLRAQRERGQERVRRSLQTAQTGVQKGIFGNKKKGAGPRSNRVAVSVPESGPAWHLPKRNIQTAQTKAAKIRKGHRIPNRKARAAQKSWRIQILTDCIKTT